MLLAGPVRFNLQNWEYFSSRSLLCPSQLLPSSRLMLWAPTLGRVAAWADGRTVQDLTLMWPWAPARAAAALGRRVCAAACTAMEVSSAAAGRIRPCALLSQH